MKTKKKKLKDVRGLILFEVFWEGDPARFIKFFFPWDTLVRKILLKEKRSILDNIPMWYWSWKYLQWNKR